MFLILPQDLARIHVLTQLRSGEGNDPGDAGQCRKSQDLADPLLCNPRRAGVGMQAGLGAKAAEAASRAIQGFPAPCTPPACHALAPSYTLGSAMLPALLRDVEPVLPRLHY